jgi:hypothetical protein
MGIHRDGAQFNFSPFEVEERRRLWWSLVGFDRRIGEMTGSTITAISNGGDCKLPLNINDSDLHLHAKEPPTSHSGPTEIIFALTRHEFSKAPGSDKMKSVLADVHPKPAANVADHRMVSYLERFATHLEETYLRHCDPKIPLHYFTIMMTRQNICKLKLLSGFFKVALSPPVPLQAAENEALFIEAIKMVEYDSMIQANESLRGFRWFTKMHFPFPAYVALIRELRSRTSGELCERAWQAIIENHQRRDMTQNMKTPMHIAFSTLFVKAWHAREAYEAQHGRTLAPPPLITTMKQLVARLGAKSKGKPSDPNTPQLIPRSFSSPEAELPPALIDTPPEPIQHALPTYSPDTTMWTGVPGLDVNKQYASAFADVNFGGEVDWQYIMQEYGGLNPQQVMAAMPTETAGQSFWP